jgi:PmbA protein
VTLPVKELAYEVLAAGSRLIEKAKARGFSESAITAQVYESAMAKFANNRVTVVQSWSTIRVTVYLSAGRKIYVTELTPSSADEIVRVPDEAARIVTRLQDSEIYAPLPKPDGKPLPGLASISVIKGMDHVAEYADLLVSSALTVASSSKAAGMVELEHGYRIVATSAGAELLEEYTSVEAYIRTLVDEASGHWAYTSTAVDDRELRAAGEVAASYALQARTRVSVEPGVYDAILSPLVVGNLIGDVAWMASALAVLMGVSIFSRYGVGSKIGSELVTIIDDPHDVELPGATGFDDEGVATMRKPVIEKGVVRTLLHNTKTAEAMKAKTTGNAGLITPSPWNVVVSPGDSKLEEMIAEVKRGLLVLNNWYTRFQNYVEGVFSTVTRDALLYIEGGEVKGGTSRLRIADTIPNLLSHVKLVGKDVYKVKWWEIPFPTKAPYMLVHGLRFTKPES